MGRSDSNNAATETWCHREEFGLVMISTTFFSPLDIFFIYISNVIPFPGLLSGTPIPSLLLLHLHHPHTHSCLSALAFPYIRAWNPWGTRAVPPTYVQQGHLLPLTWPKPWDPPKSHGSLVGDLVPRSSCISKPLSLLNLGRDRWFTGYENLLLLKKNRVCSQHA